MIELSAEERYRGMLDPLRIAPRRTRARTWPRNFLLLDPARAGAARVADRDPARRPDGRCARRPLRLRARCWPSSSAATSEAKRRRPRARGPRRARDSPGSASPRRTASRAEAGPQQLTSLRIRNLTLPLAGHRALRAARGGAHRPGAAAPARRLRAAPDGRRPEPPRGARLRRGLGAARRLGGPRAGRPDLAARPRPERHPAARHPGARRRERARGAWSARCFCFGVETDAEAERALRLLRLDPDDERLRRQLLVVSPRALPDARLSRAASARSRSTSPTRGCSPRSTRRPRPRAANRRQRRWRGRGGRSGRARRRAAGAGAVRDRAGSARGGRALPRPRPCSPRPRDARGSAAGRARLPATQASVGRRHRDARRARTRDQRDRTTGAARPGAARRTARWRRTAEPPAGQPRPLRGARRRLAVLPAPRRCAAGPGCRISGSIAHTYPVSNYGLDVQIETGITRSRTTSSPRSRRSAR